MDAEKLVSWLGWSKAVEQLLFQGYSKLATTEILHFVHQYGSVGKNIKNESLMRREVGMNTYKFVKKGKIEYSSY